MARHVCPDCAGEVQEDWWVCPNCSAALDFPPAPPVASVAPMASTPPAFAEAITEDLVLDMPPAPDPEIVEVDLEEEEADPPRLELSFLTEVVDPAAARSIPPPAADVGSYRMTESLPSPPAERLDFLGLSAERSSLAPHGRPSVDAPNHQALRELLDAATKAEVAKNIDEAVELLEQVVEVRPDASVYHRLGVLLATHTPYHARAQELLETAISLAPTNTAYSRSLVRVQETIAERKRAEVEPRDLRRSISALISGKTP